MRLSNGRKVSFLHKEKRLIGTLEVSKKSDYCFIHHSLNSRLPLGHLQQSEYLIEKHDIRFIDEDVLIPRVGDRLQQRLLVVAVTEQGYFYVNVGNNEPTIDALLGCYTALFTTFEYAAACFINETQEELLGTPEEPHTTLSMDEVAKKFGVDVDKLRIQKTGDK